MNKKLVAIVSVSVLVTLAGCNGSKNQAVNNDRTVTNQQLDRYQKNQPVPAFDYSEYRQTVIDVLNAQVHAVATTTFFFNQGTSNPIKTCPSIGFPVATTAQLTNSQQRLSGHESVVSQAEPNGVYTGDSSGTYVVCVSAGGKNEIDYWEGYVAAVGGPARWDKVSGEIVSTGPPTVVSTAK